MEKNSILAALSDRARWDEFLLYKKEKSLKALFFFCGFGVLLRTHDRKIKESSRRQERDADHT